MRFWGWGLFVLLSASPAILAVERLELPSVHAYRSGDPRALYESQMHLEPVKTLEALEAMAARGTAEVREEALVLLAQSEALGVTYNPNYPAAMKHLRAASRRYPSTDDKLAFGRRATDAMHEAARSSHDRQAARYLALAFEREVARGLGGLSIAKAVAAATTKLRGVTHEKPDPSQFSRQALEARDPQELGSERRVLRDVWRLADENFPQAQYEIGIYLFRTASKSSDPEVMRAAGVKRLWAAAGAGHRPAAETLVDYWLSHKTTQHRRYACSLVLAFREVVAQSRNRRILFSRPTPECGRPGSEQLHKPDVTAQLIALLKHAPIYLAEGNVHSRGELIWKL